MELVASFQHVFLQDGSFAALPSAESARNCINLFLLCNSCPARELLDAEADNNINEAESRVVDHGDKLISLEKLLRETYLQKLISSEVQNTFYIL